MNIRLIEGQGVALDPIQDERDRIARRAVRKAHSRRPITTIVTASAARI